MGQSLGKSQEGRHAHRHIEPASKDNPLLNGVSDIFTTTDVYEGYPPADATILLRGQVAKGLKPTDPPADYKKKRSTDHVEQGVNDPMMAIAWSRIAKSDFAKETRAFCTTIGAASDLQSEDLRRLIVNAAYWGLGMDIPAKADVNYVGEYKPSDYGFGGYRKGVKPEDLALKPDGPTTKPSAPTTGPNAHTCNAGATDASDFLHLKPEDHIAIIGNTLADRFQFDGYLETLITANHPQDKLRLSQSGAGGRRSGQAGGARWILARLTNGSPA